MVGTRGVRGRLENRAQLRKTVLIMINGCSQRLKGQQQSLHGCLGPLHTCCGSSAYISVGFLTIVVRVTLNV